MVFWLFLLFWFVAVVGVALAATTKDEDMRFLWGIFSYPALGFLSLILFSIWAIHAYDVAAVRAQGPLIQVELNRIERLTNRLNSFDYPEGALMNADSPVSSIVESLSDAENSLASAERVRARSLRSIEERKIGPMSGIVTLVGDK